jgi:hypothetical protein
MSEARIDRLEAEVREINGHLQKIEAMLSATLPYLATKGELTVLHSDLTEQLADKPGKTFRAVAITLLLAAYGLGLAGLTALPVMSKLLH